MQPRLLMLAAFCLLVLTSLEAQCLSGNCAQGSGIMIYNNGTRYIGDFRNSLREGWGSCVFADGSKYEGSWINDRPDGAGIKTFADGKILKGYWKRGNFDREDANLSFDQNYASGQYKSDCISGDCINGNGVFLYPNGDIYVGDFKQGKRHGVGVCYYANRSEYRGVWAADQPSGKGTLLTASGETKTGIWKFGQLQEIPSSNTIRETEMASSFVPNISSCLEGNCTDGYGKYIFQDSSIYTGYFSKGLPDGLGQVAYKNGDRYEGMMRAGRLHGEGSLIRSGRRITGIWENGVFQESTRPLVAEVSPSPVTEPESKVWAVVVGVAAYSHLQVLRYTDDDAYQVYSFLKSPEGGAVADERIRLLIDEAATRTNILDAMKSVFLAAGPEDLVVMYFSGHGLPGTFLPIDYNGVDNVISHEEINAILQSSRARYKLFIADACHSGGLLASRAPNASILGSYYSNLAKSQPGTALIMSSKSEETSLEASGLRQGVFSHYLIKGLKGEADFNRNKVITVQEIFDFVYFGVRKYTGNLQSPVIQGNYDRNMPVGVCR